ncbi:MAG: glycosyltransferase family 2 protein [Sulfobacillus thermosulfidooxidans]|nr:MAG: glycosyltransferase family 2 protein [Sulfobacillus thermosulfidooxidans]
MSQELVSVIVPAYNAEKTISDALNSVFNQTYRSLEVIVVDDGSTDATPHVVQEQFPRAIFKRITNQGPSFARNQGIALASGEWIAFLDADDMWHPEKIAQQLDVASTDIHIGLVATDWIRAASFEPIPPALPVSEITYEELLILNRFQTSTVLVKREIVEDLQGFDRAVDGAEDWDFWLRVAQVARLVKIDWPLVMYRDVPTGYSKNVWRVYETMLPMLEKHRNSREIGRRDFAIIETWHYLRFGVAFALMKQYDRAYAAVKPALSLKRFWYTMPAATRYLVPFLWTRYRRRRLS